MLGSHLIDSTAGQIFLTTYVPNSSAPLTQAIVVAPAFAEEMNRSRRSLHLLGIELSHRNMALIVPDLSGTGDSAGDFVDCRWSDWRCDIERTVNWSFDVLAPATMSVLGIRLGASLGAECATNLDLKQLLLWQPVDGRQSLKEFLRIGDIALSSAGSAHRTADVLKAEKRIEIGGYPLTSTLAGDIENATYRLIGPATAVQWFELASNLSHASARSVEQLRRNGAEVSVHYSESAPFWRIQEITVAEDLVRKTVSALEAANDR